MSPLGLPLKLAGQDEPVFVRLTFNRITMLEARAQLGLQRMLRQGMVASSLRWILWVGARDGKDPTRWRTATDPDWTPDAAGDLIDAHVEAAGRIEDLQAIIEEALNVGEGPRMAPVSSGQAPAPAGEAPTSAPSPTG